MPSKNIIVTCTDGTHTVNSEKFNVTYHSIHGAITESNVVFIDAGLHVQLAHKPSSIKILELGFGTGLNAHLSYIWGLQNQIPITYHSVEAFPLDQELVASLNYSDLLGHAYTFEQLHNVAWDKEIIIHPGFSLLKIYSEIETYNFTEKGSYDVVFFDAFSPASQPQLWEIPVLQKMYDALKQHGILVSYCAQGAFKRNLKACGFTIEPLPGPPGKREMTRAIKL